MVATILLFMGIIGISGISGATLQAQTRATSTQLHVSTTMLSGRSIALASVHLSGVEASGEVATIFADGKDIGSIALDAEGNGTLQLDTTRAHGNLQAVYRGKGILGGSLSNPVSYTPDAATSSTPSFALTLASSSFTLQPGAYATTITTVTPANGFTGIVGLSCTGMPEYSTCTFTPSSVQISSTGAVTSSLQIQTTAPSGIYSPSGSKIATALMIAAPLLLAFGLVSRKRVLRNALMTLSIITLFATLSGCGARYNYFKNIPLTNAGTTPGTYTVTVTAYSSNGSSASQNSNQPVAFVLTVE
jgi:hypothetical protein